MQKSPLRDYSLIAPIYDHVFHRPLGEGHRVLGRLIRSKAGKKNFKVLEVGVGSGLSLEYLPSTVNYKGVDINEKMLGLARRRLKQRRLKNATLDCMDAHRLQFNDESFDLVLASSVITAVETPMKALKEMIRVTKSGGHLAIVANLRSAESPYSGVVRMFDPLTRKFLGFRTDLDLEAFKRLKSIRLVEERSVNSLMGFPLSTYLLFEKR